MKDGIRIPASILRAVSAVAAVSPDLAGRFAAHASFRTSRRPLRPCELRLRARGERIEIPHGRHRIAAWVWGSGPTVQLVHGWNGNAAQLRAFVRPLVAAGMRVVAHDDVGHGASSGASSSLVEAADVIARVAQAIGPARAFIGYDTGGTALALALARGVVAARATFIAAPADVSRWPEQAFALRGEAAEWARVHAQARLGRSYDELALPSLGRAIRAPVLIVHDRKDREVAFEDALAAVRAIRDAGLLATEGLGHRRVLRDKGVIEDVVRFTAAELPRAWEEAHGAAEEWQAA